MEYYLTWSSFFKKEVNSTKSISSSFDFDFFVFLGIGSVYGKLRNLDRFRALSMSTSLYSTLGSASLSATTLVGSFWAIKHVPGDGYCSKSRIDFSPESYKPIK
jgi:hypothetical protein